MRNQVATLYHPEVIMTVLALAQGTFLYLSRYLRCSEFLSFHSSRGPSRCLQFQTSTTTTAKNRKKMEITVPISLKSQNSPAYFAKITLDFAIFL